MSKREIVIIIALLAVGFIAWEIVQYGNGGGRDEVAPGESPKRAAGIEEVPDAGQMVAYVPAVQARALLAAMRAANALPDLPEDAGLLAVVGNPGEFFYSRKLDGRGEVWVMKASGPELLWSTETEQILELVGAHGAELFLKFIDEPFEGPRDAWQPGGFYGLDMFAPGAGVYPVDIDDETVAMIRRDIR